MTSMTSLKRLDKILADAGLGTRSEIKLMLKSGRVAVDGLAARDGAQKLSPEAAAITLDRAPVRTDEFYYIMMNKPSSVVSATEDAAERTVIDILPERYKKLGLFPVGRLDKDTEGLLLLTNDGAWAHGITAPGRHVEKVYIAEVDKVVGEADISAFAVGITLKDETRCAPAVLEPMQSDSIGQLLCKVVLTEGKYHQVKRMLASRGVNVLHLERISMATLRLDPDLARGESRELTKNEVMMFV